MKTLVMSPKQFCFLEIYLNKVFYREYLYNNTFLYWIIITL